jgi:hypothetical protein
MRIPVLSAAAFATFCCVISLAVAPLGTAKAMGVKSEHRLVGFAFPESIGCDSRDGSMYVSQFGSALKPTQKDGAGFISKLTADGRIKEERFLPAPGQVLNKPKGIWIEGNRLWVTDIDVVWVFDLDTRRGKKVALPGIKFANDPTVSGNTLYVSDNRGDALYKVEPADFLSSGREPAVSVVFSGKSVNPNGVYPSRDGSLLMVGFKSKQEPRGVFKLRGADPVAVSDPVGRLDGVYELDDGSLLLTDWNSGSLMHWSPADGFQSLAKGFKGPADFCVSASGSEMVVAVPDLVQSEVRLIRIGM